MKPQITVNYHIGPGRVFLAMGISEKSKVLRAGSWSTFFTSAGSLLGHLQAARGLLPGSPGGHYRSRPGRAWGSLPGSQSGRLLASQLLAPGSDGPGRLPCSRPGLGRRPVQRPVRPDVAVSGSCVAVRCGRRCDFSGQVAAGLENLAPDRSIISYYQSLKERCYYKL